MRPFRPPLSGANDTGEEAQRIGFNSGKAKPPNFNTDAERLAHWEKCYGDLWKLQIAFAEKNYRRMRKII